MKQLTALFIVFALSATNIIAAIPLAHQQSNKMGGISVMVSNNGTIGHNHQTQKSGFIWHRNNRTQYLYGGGFVLFMNDETKGTKIANFGYNPSTGSSGFTPGIVADGDTAVAALASQYRVYSSLNYNENTGQELFGGTGPKWPIWSSSGFIGSNYGDYITSLNERSDLNREIKILANEDIVAIYKNTDTRLDRGISKGNNVDIDAQTRVYYFSDNIKKDMVFVNWVITNRSDSELTNLNFAPIFDVDITKIDNAFSGIDNDRMNHLDGGRIATFSTEIGDTEKEEEFGYISFKWVRLPYTLDKQIIYNMPNSSELATYAPRQIPADTDLYSDEFAKLFGNSNVITTTDQKFFMPTEEFNLLPNQSASFVIAIAMTEPNDDYPILDAITEEKIVSDMNAFSDFFNDKITSVNSSTNEEGISVYPNPVKSDFHVELEFNPIKELYFKLYDLRGNKIATLFPENRQENIFSFKITNLPTGVYILRITHGEEQKSYKIIKE